MPIPDMFSRTGNELKGSFAADAAKITFGVVTQDALDDIGLLCQQIQVRYSQNITRIWEIGTQNTYLIAGRCQGQAGLSRVLGPRPISVQFYNTYGNVCLAGGNIINFQADTGCPTGNFTPVGEATPGGLTEDTFLFVMHNTVITDFSVVVGANDMVANEQVQLMFVSLQLMQPLDGQDAGEVFNPGPQTPGGPRFPSVPPGPV